MGLERQAQSGRLSSRPHSPFDPFGAAAFAREAMTGRSMTRSRRFLFMFALIVAGEAVFSLPFLVARLFRPTLLDVFGITNLQLGTAFSLYGVVAMLSYFPGGLLADRFSARRLMAFSLLATAAGGILYSRIPSLETLTLLFGFWGFSSVLLFWAAMLRATRQWGGELQQGRAYGMLDGGRGLVAALSATAMVGLLAALLPSDPAQATLAERSHALSMVILMFTGLTASAAVLVWFCVPEETSSPRQAGSGSDAQVGQRFDWSTVPAVLKIPGLWLQAVIVVCAYVAYKSIDDFALYARDGFGMNDVESASVGTISFYMRPIAAFAAGLLADRFGTSRVLLCSFVFLCLSAGGVGTGLVPSSLPALFVIGVAAISLALNALRGVYFALFGEGAIPRSFTGTAIGLVSVIGYTPDIFMGPLMGYLTDRTPGAGGHEDVFKVVALFALIGVFATIAFQRVSARRREQVALAAS